MSVVNLSKTGVAYDNHGYHPAASTYDRRHERAQALCVNAFSVDPLFPLTFRLRFVDPRWSPFAMRHSSHKLISGRDESRTKILCSRARRGEEMFYSPWIPRSSALGGNDGCSDSEQPA